MAVLKFIVITTLLLASSGALYQYIGTKLDEQKYPPIGRMVDVGGYKLHMIEEGQNHNGPTVIVETGSGETSLGWRSVQQEIAKFTRVITYDRAGYGSSDASPLPRTSENIAKELHTMLHNAEISAPYILVGHSFGGLNMQLFANTYPDEVTGIILVDSLNEKDFQKFSVTLYENSVTYGVQLKKIMESYFGIKRLMSDLGIHKIKAVRLPTKFVVSDIEERSHFVDDAEQLRKTSQSLGDKPLIIISAGKPWPGEENADLNSVWPKLQADLVTKSSHGKQMIAEHSGHRINVEQPEIIIEAVREMIDELHNAKE